MRHTNRIRDNKDNVDEEHIKEMLGTQNLLREEMKEKDDYPEMMWLYDDFNDLYIFLI